MFLVGRAWLKETISALVKPLLEKPPEVEVPLRYSFVREVLSTRYLTKKKTAGSNQDEDAGCEGDKEGREEPHKHLREVPQEDHLFPLHTAPVPLALLVLRPVCRRNLPPRTDYATAASGSCA